LAGLPEELKMFGQLERLQIEGAGFDQFPAVVYDLANLRTLVMASGRISQFPTGISRMKQLRQISWNRIALTALPPDLGKVATLQQIELDSVTWPGITIEAGDYAALEQVAVRNCELSKIPDDLARLPRLRQLIVSRNPLTQIPSALATTKGLEHLKADGCRLESIPDDLFSLPALKIVDLTGNTFPKDEYEALERLAKSHPKIKVLMPRSGAKKSVPGAAASQEALARSIQKDLDRVGVQPDAPGERLRAERIAGTAWPVPPAIGELLVRIRSARSILAPSPTGNDKAERLDLAYQPGALDEHECIHHHPYVAVASTETYFYVVIRLDDEKPSDPMLYVIDSEDYQAHEAGKFGRLSDWLREARPAEEKPRATKKSARAGGTSGTTKKKRGKKS
jgi:hypothetical protein